MSYVLTEVKELPPDGRSQRVSANFYNDIVKDFIGKQWTYALIETPNKNPDTVHRRLESRTETSGISTFIRLGKVYLLNHALVPKDE